MQEMQVGDFDIMHTVESGQPLTFLGDERNDGRGIAYTHKDTLVEVEQKGKKLVYESYGALRGETLTHEITTRFRLKDDLNQVYENIATDPFLKTAVKKYNGMRLTKNEPWETTLCFVISQFNNVKRIRGIVKKLVMSYGEERTYSAGSVTFKFRTFPKPEVIAKASIQSLMAHGAGYRAKYIKEVARSCSDSFELERLYAMDYDKAKEELMTLDGIGDKVADCILLFGYGKLEAFPIDTWIKRAVEKVYFRGRRKSVKRIHEFAESEWGAYSGYAQQYLFWQARTLKMKA